MSDTPFILDPYIAKIPDFPKAGITFYDISPALEDIYAFSQMTKAFYEKAWSNSLEYVEARLALQTARHIAGKRILLCDDLLATGGTLAAAESLVTKVGGIVCGAVCAIELTGLKGRDKLSCPVSVLQTYEY